nr:ribonuclease H-like domain-containing protein [Tanacetum cinerariifolium]
MIKVLPLKTNEEVMARERERKARTTFLMALPEDHLAKFHKMADAKEMWEAIKSRFGCNDESKKMHKYLLKQQFEGFYVSTLEGPHKGYDRFQTLMSQLEIHSAGVSHEDANQKFLSTNDVTTAYSVSSPFVSKSQKEGSSSYTDEINDDDMEEMDLKWQVAMISNKVECFNYHKMRHFARDYRAKGNQDSKKRDDGYNGNKTREIGRRPAYQDDSKALVTIDGEDIEWSGHTLADELDSKPSEYASCESESSIETTTSMPGLVENALKDDPYRALNDKGIVDSGCSRHMTRNKAHLADYQEFKGGFVAFRGSNGRITGKGKIKSGRLDFEDVYYVEDLKHYNLFSMLQMCDKKNKVLFTDTDCLVLSPDFKLPDENQVLVKIPRQHNMYSFNLKNIDPSRDLACLFAKASIYESKKWHKRLVENQANKSAGPKEANNSAVTQANDDQSANFEEIDLHEEHFVLLIWFAYSTTVKSSEDKIKKDINFKTCEKREATHDIHNANTSSTNLLNTVSTPLSTAGPSRAFNDSELSYPDDPLMPHLEDIYASLSEGILTDSSYDDEGFIVYQLDVKSAFLYGTIDEEVYVSQPLGFVDPKFHNKKSWCDEFEKLIKNRFQISSMGELIFFFGLQVKQKEDGIFISQDKYVVEILEKFLSVKTAGTPIETQKPLVKDEEAADVDVHLYRLLPRLHTFKL